MEYIFIWPFMWLIMAVIVGIIATSKDRSFIGWFAFGLLIWPIALVAILVSSNLEKERSEQRDTEMRTSCPYCAEMIMRVAKICPHCHSELSDEWRREVVLSAPRTGESQTKQFVAFCVIFVVIMVVMAFLTYDGNLNFKTDKTDELKAYPHAALAALKQEAWIKDVAYDPSAVVQWHIGMLNTGHPREFGIAVTPLSRYHQPP